MPRATQVLTSFLLSGFAAAFGCKQSPKAATASAGSSGGGNCVPGTGQAANAFFLLVGSAASPNDPLAYKLYAAPANAVDDASVYFCFTATDTCTSDAPAAQLAVATQLSGNKVYASPKYVRLVGGLHGTVIGKAGGQLVSQGFLLNSKDCSSSNGNSPSVTPSPSPSGPIPGNSGGHGTGNGSGGGSGGNSGNSGNGGNGGNSGNSGNSGNGGNTGNGGNDGNGGNNLDPNNPGFGPNCNETPDDPACQQQ